MRKANMCLGLTSSFPFSSLNVAAFVKANETN